MALLFCDGFDHYTIASGSSPILKWDGAIALDSQSNSYPAGLSVGAGLGRSSVNDSLTGGVKFTPAAGGGSFGGASVSCLTKNLTSAVSTVVVGAAFYWFNSNPNGPIGVDSVLVSLYDGTTLQADLRLNTAGQFYFTRAGTVLGTSSLALSANQWRSVQMKITIGGTAGACEVLVDGVSWLSLAGVNTQSSTNATLGSVRVGSSTPGRSGNCASVIAYDDLYIESSNYLGDIRIRAGLPSGNGTSNQFTNAVASWSATTVTPLSTTILDSNSNLQRATAVSGTGTTGSSAPAWNATAGGNTTDNAGSNQVIWTNLGPSSAYKLVNESSPDGDSSYLTDATVGDQSRFTFPTTAGQTVIAVAVQMYARKDDAGVRTIRAVAKSGATVGDSGIDLTLSTTPGYVTGYFSVDPQTGVGWTVPGVNAAEFGVKTTA